MEAWRRSLHPRVKVIAFDACTSLIALNKPPNILTHPNDSNDHLESLFGVSYDFDQECYQSSDGPVWLINRLDKGSSGLLLASLSKKTSDSVKRSFANAADVKKTYVALCLKRRLLHMPVARMDRISRSPIIEVDWCLMQLKPITGRTHQLRYQCARRGLPIFGDPVYGDFNLNASLDKHIASSKRELIRNEGSGSDPIIAHSNLRRMYLHSAHIHVKYTLGGNKHSFEANCPMPPEFLSLMDSWS